MNVGDQVIVTNINSPFYGWTGKLSQLPVFIPTLMAAHKRSAVYCRVKMRDFNLTFPQDDLEGLMSAPPDVRREENDVLSENPFG